MINKRWIRERK